MNGHLLCTLSRDQQLFWALTYVKSCRITLAGIKGISTFCFWLFSQSKIFSTSFDFTWKPSQLRTADSSSTLIENGRRPKEVKYKIPLFNTLSTGTIQNARMKFLCPLHRGDGTSFLWDCTRWKKDQRISRKFKKHINQSGPTWQPLDIKLSSQRQMNKAFPTGFSISLEL